MKKSIEGTEYTFGTITSIHVKGYGNGLDETSQMEFTIKEKGGMEPQHFVVLTPTFHRPEMFNASVSFVSAAYFAGKEIGVEYVPSDGTVADSNQIVTVFSPSFSEFAKGK